MDDEIIRCALIDELDVYQGMVEVPASQVTERHLTQITACDLPVGEYRWARNAEGQLTGPFVPLPRVVREAAGKLAKEPPSLEFAMIALCDALQGQGIALPQITQRWLDHQLNALGLSRYVKKGG